MSLQQRLQRGGAERYGYGLSGLAGAALFVGYWWITGTVLSPHMKVTFSEPPVFTRHAKKLILAEFAGMRDYLSELGFEVPTFTPPVQIHHIHGGMISGPSEYSYTIFLTDEMLSNPMSLRSAYVNFVFARLLKWPEVSLADQPNKWPAGVIIAQYFVSSYSDIDYSDHKGWEAALWKLRGETSKDFMDHSVYYMVQLFETVPGDPKGEINKYFRDRLERGLLVMQNPGTAWRAQLDAIVQADTSLQ